jgi:hypothetical protein
MYRGTIRAQFEEEDSETLIVSGLGLSATGLFLWSGADGTGLNSVLSISVILLGVAVLLYNVVWGTSEQAQENSRQSELWKRRYCDG